jgi:hypothetical protein
MTNDNAKIIEVAVLMNKVDQLEDSGNEGEEFRRTVREFQTAHKLLEPDEMAMVKLASRLMTGKPFIVTSDNPESIRRDIALAQEIGATFGDSMDDPLHGPKAGITSITFFPPSHPVQ